MIPFWRTLDLKSSLTHILSFTTCNYIPKTGAITIRIPIN